MKVVYFEKFYTILSTLGLIISNNTNGKEFGRNRTKLENFIQKIKNKLED